MRDAYETPRGLQRNPHKKDCDCSVCYHRGVGQYSDRDGSWSKI